MRNMIAGTGALVVVLMTNVPVDAGLVLLGTISNTWHGTDPSVIEEYSMGDRLLYIVVGYPWRGDLFEDERANVRRDEPPVTLDQSLTANDDPDFELIADLMTDGVSLGGPDGAGFQEISVLGLIGGEDILDVHVPRISEYDLFGYRVERIDREVTFSITSCIEDAGASACGTEFHIGGVYQFWGSVVPEPGALWLLATGMPVVWGGRWRRIS